MVGFSEWQSIDLRIAKVLNVEDIAGKDKLYKIQIDLQNGDKRQIVAGLKPYYKKDELIGKRIVVVANLEPATIAGIESQAMLLAVKDSAGRYKVLAVDETIPAGTRVE